MEQLVGAPQHLAISRTVVGVEVRAGIVIAIYVKYEYCTDCVEIITRKPQIHPSLALAQIQHQICEQPVTDYYRDCISLRMIHTVSKLFNSRKMQLTTQ